MLCVILEFGLKNSVACSMHYDILITYMLLIQLSVLCVNFRKKIPCKFGQILF